MVRCSLSENGHQLLFNPFFNLISSQVHTVVNGSLLSSKCMAAVHKMGAVGGSANLIFGGHDTIPLYNPHSTNLRAYPQHMTMTGIREFHTRNSFQAVKFDQVREFLVLLPKINYTLYHSKWKTFIAQNMRQFVQTEQTMLYHHAQRKSTRPPDNKRSPWESLLYVLPVTSQLLNTSPKLANYTL